MKKLVIAVIAAATLVLMAGLASAATTSTTMNVLLNIGAAVQVSTTDMNFGSITAGDPGPASSSTITVTAPNGMPYTIAINAGQNYTSAWRSISDGLGNTVWYGLFDPVTGAEWSDVGYGDTYPYGGAVAGTGTGVAQPFTVNGSIVGFTGVPAGAYSDVVLVTVNY